MKMKNVITNYNYKNNKLCFFAGLQESQEIAGIAGN